MTVPEPLEHSVVGVPNEVGNSSGDIVTVSEPIEHSVVGVPNTVGKSSVDIVTGLEPIEHSVVVRGPHDVGDSSVDIVTVPDLIEHSGVRGTADPPSTGQLMLNSKFPGTGKMVGRTACVTMIRPWTFGRKTSGFHLGRRRPS